MKSFVFGISVLLCIAFLADSYVAGRSRLDESRKYDEFGNITCEDELARLDSFLSELQGNSNTQAYVIVYGGRRGRRNEAKARAARMKFYLVNTRRFDAERIVTIDGGFREELSAELFIAPPGAPAPTPAPTVHPKGVKLKGKARVYGYNCGAFIG